MKLLGAVRTRMEHGDDAGFTLAEMLVAMFLITGSVLGLLAGLTNALQAHRTQRDEAAAERVATQSLEQARNLPFSSLTSLVGAPVTAPVTGANGTSYTTTTSIQNCSVGDRGAACTTPASGAPSDVHVTVNVTWQEGGRSKSLAVGTGVTNDATGLVAGSGSGTLSGLVGAASSGTTVSVTSLTVNPTSVTVDALGHPVAPVVVTANVVGLTSATSFPVTWTDDTGSHQATMAASAGTTFTATIPAANIQKVVTVGQTAAIPFAVVVPGSQAVPSTPLTVTPVAPPTLTCSVTPLAIVLVPLTTKTSLATALGCTATGLGTADSVAASWTGTTGTVTGRLASTNGATWTLSLPAGTSLPASLAEKFTFTATRASDSATVSATATATVA